jgi:hypothetical protein
MNQVDLHNNISVAIALEAQTIDSDTTTEGEIIDRQGFESLEFVLATGEVTDGDFTPVLMHGEEDDLSDETEVSAEDLEMLGTLEALDESGAITKVGYRGIKRYVRLDVESANTDDGGVVGATAVLSGARNNP